MTQVVSDLKHCILLNFARCLKNIFVNQIIFTKLSRVHAQDFFMWSTGPGNFEFCKIIQTIWNLCCPETVNPKINMSEHKYIDPLHKTQRYGQSGKHKVSSFLSFCKAYLLSKIVGPFWK